LRHEPEKENDGGEKGNRRVRDEAMSESEPDWRL
jgi:hypothetical protein